MAYPDNKPSGEYALRDYDFGTLDTNKLPMDEYLFKNGYKNAEESLTESVPDAHNANWLYDVLHRNIRYTQQVAEENKYQLENKLATPTSIGQVKIGYGLEITSGGVLSVQKSIAEDANIISYDLPVGSYMLWAGKNTPEYFIEPAGQILLKSNYPDLWKFAQNNDLIGKLFAEIDDSSFKVIDIRGDFIKIANDNSQVGAFTEAGLPNITGTFKPCVQDTNHSNASGAFDLVSRTDKTTVVSGTWINDYLPRFNFDASRSSAVYGKNKTVMPANWGLKLILKALPTPPSNAVPTGTILDYSGLNAPDGYIIPNGAELSRTTFSNLWNWANVNGLVVKQNTIPNTAHGYYGTGDGSTTFTIPDLRGVFGRWADLASNRGGTNARIYQADGLPGLTVTVPCTGWGVTGSSPGTITAGRLIVGSGNKEIAETLESLKAAGINRTATVGGSYQVRPKSVSLTPILKY